MRSPLYHTQRLIELERQRFALQCQLDQPAPADLRPKLEGRIHDLDVMISLHDQQLQAHERAERLGLV